MNSTPSTTLTDSPRRSPEHEGFNAWNNALALAGRANPLADQDDVELVATAGMIACGYRFDAAANAWIHPDDLLLAKLHA